MNAIGYPRVSTEDQGEHGLSLEAQEAKIRAYCDAQGLTLVDVVPSSESAASLDREGLGVVLKALDLGRAEVLVVARLDRLTRDVGDWSILLKQYFSAEGQKALRSCSEDVDTRSANGRMMLNILFSVAQHARERDVERATEIKGFQRTAGTRMGSVPYGFDLNPAGRVNRHGRPIELVENGSEQTTLRWMSAWRFEGLGTRQIAAKLNSLGIVTKTGKGKWSHAAVAKILSRKVDS